MGKYSQFKAIFKFLLLRNLGKVVTMCFTQLGLRTRDVLELSKNLITQRRKRTSMG